MSRRGNPCDDALVESFFKTLQHEEVLAFDYETVDDVVRRLPHFLEEVCDRHRLHSALGYSPPEEYETLNQRPAAQVSVRSSTCPTDGVHSCICAIFGRR